MATKHFTDKELACSCHCGTIPNKASQNALEDTRLDFGHPVYISSGGRCKKYQDQLYSDMGLTPIKEPPHVPGAWNKFQATAFDIRYRTFFSAAGKRGTNPNEELARFLECARKNGFCCLGIGKRNDGTQVIHIDMRPMYRDKDDYLGWKRIWTY